VTPHAGDPRFHGTILRFQRQLRALHDDDQKQYRAKYIGKCQSRLIVFE
jgi:hypothetical protein